MTRDAPRWQFRQFEPGPDHLLGARGVAGCTGSGMLTVTLREFRARRLISGQEQRAQA